MNPKLTAQIQVEQNRGRKLRQATPTNWRKELVKVAGLACSAVEALDRRQKRLAKKEGTK